MSLKTKTVEWMARTAMHFPRSFLFLFRAQDWSRRKWKEATPGERAWKGAALGLLVATLIVVADSILHRSMLPSPTYDRVASAGRALREAVLSGVGMVVLATVIARTPCEVVVLSAEFLRAFLTREPTIAAKVLFNLSRTLASRLAETSASQ